jgi:hypothetical protein
MLFSLAYCDGQQGNLCFRVLAIRRKPDGWRKLTKYIDRETPGPNASQTNSVPVGTLIAERPPGQIRTSGITASGSHLG